MQPAKQIQSYEEYLSVQKEHLKYWEDNKEALLKGDRESPEWKNYFAVNRSLIDFWEKSPKWEVYCTVACYVGQGMSFEPNDTVQEYLTEQEAKDHVDRINKGSWAKNCFSHRPKVGK